MARSIFLTSYFTKKPHPQASDHNTIGLDPQGYVHVDSFEYIGPWYNSIVENNLRGIIFHDGLSDYFINKYRNDNVTFWKVSTSDYSNNDYRFFCYLGFLNLTNNGFDYVYLTDCCDVTVVKDPSDTIERDTLYFCRDDSWKTLKEYSFAAVNFFDICGTMGWQNLELLNHRDKEILNMGVIGGDGQTIKKFLSLFKQYRESSVGSKSANVNMTLGNLIARVHFSNIVTGPPFCSEYKKNQIDREDVYFVHK